MNSQHVMMKTLQHNWTEPNKLGDMLGERRVTTGSRAQDIVYKNSQLISAQLQHSGYKLHLSDWGGACMGTLSYVTKCSLPTHPLIPCSRSSHVATHPMPQIHSLYADAHARYAYAGAASAMPELWGAIAK